MKYFEYEVLEDYERVVFFSDGSKYIVRSYKGDIIRTTNPPNEVYKKLIEEGKIKPLHEYNE
ncbi:hypothetical protein D7X33_23825 [Butyricicoccus sp. 1XD8-22]|nr:hypothetical protein D7X33_23825 [Butyricicoccus sp. 1XD8-22]